VKHILVVDDEAAVRVLLQKILESAGYRVTAASDGASALKAAREGRPDLVICDILMPGMDGLTVCSTFMRNKLMKVPILAISGHVSENAAHAAHEAGADAFIQKPIEREKLLSVVAEWLAVGELRGAAGASIPEA
jgi:CheY-like chemotaxis protein